MNVGKVYYPDGSYYEGVLPSWLKDGDRIEELAPPEVVTEVADTPSKDDGSKGKRIIAGLAAGVALGTIVNAFKRR